MNDRYELCGDEYETEVFGCTSFNLGNQRKYCRNTAQNTSVYDKNRTCPYCISKGYFSAKSGIPIRGDYSRIRIIERSDADDRYHEPYGIDDEPDNMGSAVFEPENAWMRNQQDLEKPPEPLFFEKGAKRAGAVPHIHISRSNTPLEVEDKYDEPAVELTADGVFERPESPWTLKLKKSVEEQPAPKAKPTEKLKAGSPGSRAKGRRAGSPDSNDSSWEAVDDDIEGSGVLVPQVSQAKKGMAKGEAPTKGGPSQGR